MAFTAEIVERTADSETDKRAKLAKAAYVSTMDIGATWTKLRILVRLSFTTAKADGDYDGYPALYLGLCHGKLTPPGTATPAHFAGIKFGNTLRKSTSGIYLAGNTSSNNQQLTPTVIKNGSVTSSTPVGINFQLIKLSTDGRSAFGFTVERSGTDLSLTPYILNDCDITSFGPALESSLTTPSGFSGPGSATTISPDEATYGDLDTICFSFIGGDDAFELSDFDYYRMA